MCKLSNWNPEPNLDGRFGRITITSASVYVCSVTSILCWWLRDKKCRWGRPLYVTMSDVFAVLWFMIFVCLKRTRRTWACMYVLRFSKRHRVWWTIVNGEVKRRLNSTTNGSSSQNDRATCDDMKKKRNVIALCLGNKTIVKMANGHRQYEQILFYENN